MSGLFCIKKLLEVRKKQVFLILWIFTPSKIKLRHKSLTKKTSKFTKKSKSKKNQTKVCHLTKTSKR